MKSMRYGAALGVLVATGSANEAEAYVAEIEQDDAFGGHIVTGDFNHDGFADLVVSAQGQKLDAVAGDDGTLSVYYGLGNGRFSSPTTITSNNSISGSNVLYLGPTSPANQPLNSTLAVGDFDNDGNSDLAIGVRNTSFGSTTGAGQVYVIYGIARAGNTMNGLTTASVKNVYNLANLHPTLPAGWGNQKDANFGAFLGVGDFNCDGRDDLAISIPLLSVPVTVNGTVTPVPFAGGALIAYSAAGAQAFDNNKTEIWAAGGGTSTVGADYTKSAGEPGEVLSQGGGFAFGDFAVGNFNGDKVGANECDDLAITSCFPDNLSSPSDVRILHGASAGLAYRTKFSEVTFGEPVPSQHDFGRGMAAGDFNGDGMSDLAVGIPYSNSSDLGHVHVVYGVAGTGLSVTGSVKFQRGVTSGLEGTALPAQTRSFGIELAARDLNGDGKADLAVGVRDSTNGAVQVIYSGPAALQGLQTTAPNDVIFQQGAGILGDPASGEFAWNGNPPGEGSGIHGQTLAIADFNSDGRNDLAVSDWKDTVGSKLNAGEVNILYGADANGLSAAGNTQVFDQGCPFSTPADCVDADGDGLFAKTETGAAGRTVDTNGDTDGDGLSDGFEIKDFDRTTGAVTATRSDPLKKSIYNVLFYDPAIITSAFPSCVEVAGQPATALGCFRKTLKDNLNAYFPDFDMQYAIQPVANAGTYNTGCDATLASTANPPSTQQGWLGSTGAARNLASAALEPELAALLQYGHVGRLCMDAVVTKATVQGAIRYRGGWEYLVRMRLPEAITPIDTWHTILASQLAHELGHSLGLHHGGDNDADCSPLYPSVMNHAYDFQLPQGVDTYCPTNVRFSNGVLRASAGNASMQLASGTTEWYSSAHLERTKTGSSVGDADLDFLQCFANGDLMADRISAYAPQMPDTSVECTGGESNAFCVNWDRDENPGAYGGFQYDVTYDPAGDPDAQLSVFNARTGGGAGPTGGTQTSQGGTISGCAYVDFWNQTGNIPMSVLYPTSTLRDHDDLSYITSHLPYTINKSLCDNVACNDTRQVVEPGTANKPDGLSKLWEVAVSPYIKQVPSGTGVTFDSAANVSNSRLGLKYTAAAGANSGTLVRFGGASEPVANIKLAQLASWNPGAIGDASALTYAAGDIPLTVNKAYMLRNTVANTYALVRVLGIGNGKADFQVFYNGHSSMFNLWKTANSTKNSWATGSTVTMDSMAGVSGSGLTASWATRTSTSGWCQPAGGAAGQVEVAVVATDKVSTIRDASKLPYSTVQQPINVNQTCVMHNRATGTYAAYTMTSINSTSANAKMYFNGKSSDFSTFRMVVDNCTVYNAQPSSTYYYCTTLTSYPDAAQACSQVGGYLATISSAAENAYIDTMPGWFIRAWIGGTDTATEGTWVNPNGVTFRPATGAYTNWASGEPNSLFQEEDCLMMEADAKWNDVPCTVQDTFVCEVPK